MLHFECLLSDLQKTTPLQLPTYGKVLQETKRWILSTPNVLPYYLANRDNVVYRKIMNDLANM